MRGETAALISGVKDELIARQDRAVETIAVEISNMGDEFKLRFNDVARRLDRLTETTGSLQVSIQGLNRWADQLDSAQTGLGQSYYSQQRAIEALTVRVAALESKQQPGR